MSIIHKRKKISTILLASSLLTVTSTIALVAFNDSRAEAKQTNAAANGNWNEWCTNWEKSKNNYAQVSLTPGKNASELNFAWYSKNSEPAPKLKFGKNKDLSDGSEISVTSKSAISGYKSNKATVANLVQNTTYYYSYQINGQWTEPTVYKTQSTKNFSFLYVGDPQIGASSSNNDNAARNDSFNWNNTLNVAIKNHDNVSFLLSAGDQVDSGDNENKIEYTGYLSPDVLKSLPAATAIGNHDASNPSYSYHFNNPNASNLGSTAAGGDYYFSYGNALFITLNTNNSNITEHEQVINQAISSNPNSKWRIVTVHQDIYGSGEHSNEPSITNLRYKLAPIFEKNNIDVVLSGHDHIYSRSFILKGDSQDSSAIQNSTKKDGFVINPKGILYMTASSSTGSKFYNLVPNQQSYIAARWQDDTPTYSVIDINDSSLNINTYRTDNNTTIDNTFSIVKKANNSDASWLLNNGSWYYLNSSGVKTGWQSISGTWYYLDNEGKMKTGWFKDTDGKWYYLQSSGAMASNTTIDGYQLGSNGAWIS